MALPNYVKFQRGTKLAFENLSQKDQNTLYFIYDPNHDNRGELWLGNRLIIGNIGEGGSGATSLYQLTDVIIENAGAGSLLVRDSNGNWKSTPASDIAQLIVESGGNFVTIDENEFQFSPVDGKLELKGYAEADLGFIPVKGDTGIIWQAAPADLNLSTRVGNLESSMSIVQNDISNLQNQLSTVDGRISALESLNHLSYQVVDSLSEATATNIIYLYEDSETANNIYTEYMLLNGQLEIIGSTAADLSQYATKNDVLNLSTRVGTLEVDLNNYVLKTEFQAVIGDLNLVNSVKNDLESDASVSETLTDIYQRLTWQEIH